MFHSAAERSLLKDVSSLRVDGAHVSNPNWLFIRYQFGLFLNVMKTNILYLQFCGTQHLGRKDVRVCVCVFCTLISVLLKLESYYKGLNVTITTRCTTAVFSGQRHLLNHENSRKVNRSHDAVVFIILSAGIDRVIK